MPRPRMYDSPAAKQAAYRARLRELGATLERSGAPGYLKWRKAVQEAYGLLSAVYEELGDWMEERSERWQQSDRAGELEADRDKLYEILDALDELSIRDQAAGGRRE